ncbi:MAG TPA: Rieske 2Fe-2S domain-containing protein [Thermoanaerobaculia bacterium]|nr:Rieske 2Fe-2S domain-containing protein [Thermoanaerobaculia bacterium]
MTTTTPTTTPTGTTADQLSVPPDGKPYHDQPQWRNDFPIDWPQDEFVARRDFTKFLVLTSFAFVAGQLWIVMENFFRKRRGQLPVRRIARADEIPVGGSLVFEYPEPHDICIVVRTGYQLYFAFNQKCTHLACAVVPDLAHGRFHCPCHNGFFEMRTGIPTAGPPRRPLERILLEIRDGDLYAIGREVRA